MNDLIPLKGSLQLPSKFVSCFNESLNKVVYSKQMDIYMTYFDEINKQVKHVYIGSQFMGHATVDDMIKDFKEAHNGLDYEISLIQFSMDDLNTNWAFRGAVSDLRKSGNPFAPDLLKIGRCGLHVVHGAFGTAVGKTDWKMGQKLNATWSIFKKSSTRRSDYLSVNNIECRNEYNSVKEVFPLKYVGRRWLKNGKVMDRLLLVGNKLLVFLRQYKKEKKFPRHNDRFPLLLELFSLCTGNDQYELCLVVIRDIEPFLALLRSEKPLAPFLFQKLKGLIVLILQRFDKASVIRKTSTNTFKLINLKLEGNNLLPLHEIDVDLGAKSVLKKLKTVDKPEERKFRANAQIFLIEMAKKIFEGPHWSASWRREFFHSPLLRFVHWSLNFWIKDFFAGWALTQMQPYVYCWWGQSHNTV